MFRVLFILSIVVAIGSGLKVPSVTHLLDNRIVGGTATTVQDFPWQVSLRYKSTNSHFCGGSIYASRVIVTAAHCLSGQTLSNIVVYAGVSKLDEKATALAVERLIVNSKYNSATIDNDVGLVILSQKITYGATMQPIALAEVNPPAGLNAITTGWGTTREGGSLSNTLQEVTVQIVSQSSCASSYGSSAITDRMVCAGVPQGGKDACQGDSGGPLVTEGKLVGIVSWGRGCARSGYPGVYSSVANLRSWIVDNSAPYL